MDRSELRAWLRLVLTPKLGLASARKVLAALGSPQAVVAATPEVLASLLPPREARALQTEPEGLDAHVEATLAWLAAADPSGGARAVLSLADARYPALLLEASDPPLLLFALGDLALLGRPAVAMVGSRHASPQGVDTARSMAQALSAAGLVVVSGLADGIDGVAHDGALVAAEADPAHAGSSIAVVGTGLDRVYPAKHRGLAHRMARQGLLLSEFLLGTPPIAANFPRRNRIVAALSRGTLVVEAALQSGSLITARLAAEMGREVMAVPGSILSPQARGAHALIKQGAALIESAQDVLDALGWARDPAHAPAAGHADVDPASAEGGDPLLQAMGYEPVTQDALAARTGISPAELGARLLMLELDGVVARLPGQLFQRRAHA